MPPIAVAANVVQNESPSAKAAAGANNVFTVDNNTTDRIFQIIIIHIRHFELVEKSHLK